MYPANRGFFLTWLLAFTNWFAWLVRRKERHKQTNYATVKPRERLYKCQKPRHKENSTFHVIRNIYISRVGSVSSSLWLLNQRTEDAFFTGLASIWSNIFTNSNEKKTCLLLCLLCIFKFQTLTCRNFWIFYFMSRLTLHKCAVNVCIQR